MNLIKQKKKKKAFVQQRTPLFEQSVRLQNEKKIENYTKNIPGTGTRPAREEKNTESLALPHSKGNAHTCRACWK